MSVNAAGEVLLSGVAVSEEDRRRIEEDARTTPGVTRVYSELKVAAEDHPLPPPKTQPISPGVPQTLKVAAEDHHFLLQNPSRSRLEFRRLSQQGRQ